MECVGKQLPKIQVRQKAAMKPKSASITELTFPKIGMHDCRLQSRPWRMRWVDCIIIAAWVFMRSYRIIGAAEFTICFPRS